MTRRYLNLVLFESQDPSLSNDTKFKYLHVMGVEEIIFEKAQFLSQKEIKQSFWNRGSNKLNKYYVL